jgi:hypothetical protein
VKLSNMVQAGNRMVGCILEESKDVLGDIGVRPRGVRVPITWQSVALGDAASFKPTTPKLYERWLVRPWQGTA